MPTRYLPDLLYTDGAFRSDFMIETGDDGVIARVGEISNAGEPSRDCVVVKMPNRAVLPGLVNGHSHSFQRLIRGVAEHRANRVDDFWTWRTTMYRAASQLRPDDLFDVARMTFLEMALAGITTVGEFHYVHRDLDGKPYEDPNELGKRVIAAACSVGLRICLLRVAYERSGFELAPNPGQQRFYEGCEEFIENAESLAEYVRHVPAASMGVAPHSVRAVPLSSLKRISAWAEERRVPIHMHIAEQTAEINASEREYGLSPIRLLRANGLLSSRLTLVHAIHTDPDEVRALSETGVTICSCPTTERNLGDGIIDAEEAITAGIPFSFGSDSQAAINLLEDARELDYHLRLKQQRRVVLDGIDGIDMSTRLFRYATEGGAHSLGLNTGLLEAGRPADFFSVNLDDVSIAGASTAELLPTIVFSLERTAVCDVVVDGRAVIQNGSHSQANEIVAKYRALSRRIAAS